MVSRTGIILLVFCAALLAQTACAAGQLAHCDHPPAQTHGRDHCPDDHCHDDFPVPGKLAPLVLQAAVPAAAVGFAPAVFGSTAVPARLSDQPRICPSARPCGSYPLLI